MIRRSASLYAAALDRAWDESDAKTRPAVVRSFLQLIIRQRSAKLLPRIIDRLQALDLARRKTQAVTVQVATAAAGQTVTTELKKALGKIEVTVQEDQAVLGGAAIRLGDTVIDGTIATQLKRLHTQLTS